MKDNFRRVCFGNHCPVCGAEHSHPPWGENGKEPSFDLCLCCEVQFGYQDVSLKNSQRYRNVWLRKGAFWKFGKFKPKDWSLENQLAAIYDEEEVERCLAMVR